MSKYTTEVRFICEQAAGKTESTGLSDVNDVISAAWSKIFENFPIYDENHRAELCMKILRHYYMREICAETVALWKLWLNERMAEIMPYYNQLYQSADLKYDPLIDVDYKTEHNRSNEGTTQGQTDSNSNNTRSDNFKTDSTDNGKNLYSDTPQGALTGVENGEYLTNATLTEGKATQTNTGTQTNAGTSQMTNSGSFGNTEHYTESVKGKRNGQTYQKMIMEYRETILNIDSMIIDELKDLFMMVW